MRPSMVRQTANLTLANGAQIPKLGLGTWKMTKQEAAPAVAHALKVGYRHIDCAWAYRNEDAVGASITKSGISRQQLWITSKLWNSFHQPENVEKCLDATLKDLGTDYLDLWLMHWPVAFVNSKGAQIASIRSTAGHPIEQPELSKDFMTTYRVMEEMVKKGKVRNIGVSNFNIRRIGQLVQEANIKPVINQVEVNWGVHNEELRNYSHAHDLTLQGYSPFGGNQNASRYLSDPVIVDVAKRNNMTPAQVLLAWQLGREIIPIAKSITPERIEENLQVLEKQLPEGDLQHLTSEAQSKPIERTVDPTEGWKVAEEIFEDGIDQTREMELKGDSYVGRPAHESPKEHRLEPRNAQLFHTMTSSRASVRRSTVLQDAISKRFFFRSFASSSKSADAAVVKTPTVRKSGWIFSKKDRKYPARKAFLYDQYARVLKDNKMVILLQYGNLTVKELSKFRRDIAAVQLPEDETRSASFTVVRSGLMKAVCRAQKEKTFKSLVPLFSGPVALLTCSHLSPKYLSSLLTVVDKAFGHVPPRAPAKHLPFPVVETVNPRLTPLAAVLEGNKLLEMHSTREVGRMSPLSELRSQIVGLLSAPGQQLAGVVSQAAGGHIALTLEARKRSLEEQNPSTPLA